MPESPRWLIAKNRKEAALKILQKAAKINKMPQPQMEMLEADGKKDIPIGNETIIDLFRTPNLRKRSICILFNWFTSGFCFFGLAQYTSRLKGDIFWNVAISGLSDFACFVGFILFLTPILCFRDDGNSWVYCLHLLDGEMRKKNDSPGRQHFGW